MTGWVIVSDSELRFKQQKNILGFQQQICVAWNIHDEYLGYILRLHGTLRSDASHSGSRVACLAESAEMGSEEAFEITDLVIYQPADEAGGKWAKGIQNNGPWDFWRNDTSQVLTTEGARALKFLNNFEETSRVSQHCF